MFIMYVLANQLHFLANRNAKLAVTPLFWPVNCIKIGGYVLLSDSTVNSLYCGFVSLLCDFTPTKYVRNRLTKTCKQQSKKCEDLETYLGLISMKKCRGNTYAVQL